MTGDGLGDGLGDEGGVRGTSMIAVTLAVSISGVYFALSDIILLPCPDVRKKDMNRDLLDIRQDARRVLKMSLREYDCCLRERAQNAEAWDMFLIMTDS